MPVVTRRRTIAPDLARSWQLVNADRPELLEEASRSPADQIVLDLEDAVDPSRKTEALDRVVAWLEGGREAWVRINDRTSDFWADDIARLGSVPGLLGVMLAKTEVPDHVTETHDRLGGRTPIVALIESALGIEEAVGIARARGVFRLAFGSGDYRRDTGTSGDDLAMAYPRSRLVMASRIGDLPGPIDGPSASDVESIVQEQTRVAVALGLTGKLCLRPGQARTINEVMRPTAADVTWAIGFLEDFEARGRVVRDGSDPPRLARAQKIAGLASAFGFPGGGTFEVGRG